MEKSDENVIKKKSANGEKHIPQNAEKKQKNDNISKKSQIQKDGNKSKNIDMSTVQKGNQDKFSKNLNNKNNIKSTNKVAVIEKNKSPNGNNIANKNNQSANNLTKKSQNIKKNSLESKDVRDNQIKKKKEDISSKKIPKKEKIDDTLGDTKIYKRITREDIEREKRRQAIIKENETKNNEKNKTQSQKKNPTNLNNYEKKNNNKNLNNYEKKNNEKTFNNYESGSEETTKSKRKPLMLTLILLIFILIVVLASTIFGIINQSNDKIIRGIYINNIDVSCLTRDEAQKKVDEELNNEENNYIKVVHGEYSREIHLSDVGGEFCTEESVEKAYQLGRMDDIILNNYKTIETMIKHFNIAVSFKYNEDLIEEISNEVALELPDVAIDSSYIVDGNKIVIKNSKDGIQMKSNEFKQAIIDAFANGEKDVEIPVEQVERKEIDIDKIHEEIYKAPKDAYFTNNPYKVYKEEDGLDFAISLEQAKELISEEKVEYEIPLTKVKPKVTVNDLGDEAFPDQLSTFTTNYGTGDTNRNTNIAIAARSINSVVVMPGETFSYNDLIGECSTRTGYKVSTIYVNGQLSTGVGGGICQVSTTLYNAVLRANLEIVERRNHSLGVTYVPAGHDAMVSIGSSDFKFKNNRNYPVKVVAFVGTGSITCQIYGLKQDKEYEVKLASTTIESTETRYKVQTYKILYLNGEEVSRTLLSTDTYKRH